MVMKPRKFNPNLKIIILLSFSFYLLYSTISQAQTFDETINFIFTGNKTWASNYIGSDKQYLQRFILKSDEQNCKVTIATTGINALYTREMNSIILGKLATDAQSRFDPKVVSESEAAMKILSQQKLEKYSSGYEIDLHNIEKISSSIQNYNIESKTVSFFIIKLDGTNIAKKLIENKLLNNILIELSSSAETQRHLGALNYLQEKFCKPKSTSAF